MHIELRLILIHVFASKIYFLQRKNLWPDRYWLSIHEAESNSNKKRCIILLATSRYVLSLACTYIRGFALVLNFYFCISSQFPRKLLARLRFDEPFNKWSKRKRLFKDLQDDWKLTLYFKVRK